MSGLASWLEEGSSSHLILDRHSESSSQPGRSLALPFCPAVVSGHSKWTEYSQTARRDPNHARTATDAQLGVSWAGVRIEVEVVRIDELAEIKERRVRLSTRLLHRCTLTHAHVGAAASFGSPAEALAAFGGWSMYTSCEYGCGGYIPP